jgi:all-trans-8'-apo-beta-carotenal 15,15'-oxygenase
MQLLSKKTYLRSGFGVAHDMAITKNFVVMFQAPVHFDPVPWIFGQKCLGQCITQPDDMKATATSKLHLFPRDPSLSSNGNKSDEALSPITIDIPMSFSFHTVNAFESSDGKTLSVDAVMTERMFMAETQSTAYPTQPIWDTINYSQDLPPYSIRRYTIDLTTRSLLNIQTMTGSWSKTVDFPTIHPKCVSKPYRYTYVLAGINAEHVTPVQGLCKVDVQQGMEIQKWIPKHEYQFLTELVFVPRGSDDDNNNNNNNDEDYGYLVGYLLNGRERTKSQFVVFDARDITKGPIVQATLKTGLAHALHGTFVKGYTPSMNEALSSYTAANK